jgi:3-oxoacyl-[acyl-carrier-protein] synthase II
MTERAVAITGIGVVCPLGIGRHALEIALREGRSGIAEIDRFDTSACRSHHAALVRGFRADQIVHPNRLRRMDPLSAQAVAAATLAVQDAGLRELSRSTPSRATGVAFGTGYGCQTTTLRYAKKLVEQGAYFTNPIDFPDSVDGAPAGHIAIQLGLQGPSTTLVDGGLSGETAVWHAALAIQSGRAQRMLAGGGDELTETLHRVLDELGLWCAADESGQQLMCPYDGRRRGPLPGEATAMLVLESSELAERRGAHVYARLLGFGHGAALGSMRAALSAAGIESQQVDLFSGAGASLPGLDEIELRAANELWGEGTGCSLVAIKSSVGEFEAAGALRLAALALAVGGGFVPASLNLEQPRPATGLRFSARAEPWPVRHALHHGLARGGQSLSLLLGRP